MPAAREQVVKPERVLVYTKKMVVAWDRLDERLRAVRSLDDVMRIDLHYLCRHARLSWLPCVMQPLCCRYNRLLCLGCLNPLSNVRVRSSRGCTFGYACS